MLEKVQKFKIYADSLALMKLCYVISACFKIFTIFGCNKLELNDTNFVFHQSVCTKISVALNLLLVYYVKW
jgi:hypothetical protein